jgi:hypothetical protein
MKISLLIVDDEAQVTLSPETKAEEAVLAFLHQEPLAIEIRRSGEFQKTQGGYFREFDHSPVKQSTMLVLTKSRVAEKTEGPVPSVNTMAGEGPTASP